MKEQEREELHRTIWAIANDLRGAVDGWDFKQYVLGILFYRYISENLAGYINQRVHETGQLLFDYARMSDIEAENGRQEMVDTKGFYIKPSELFCNVLKRASRDENLNETLERVFRNIEQSAQGTPSEDDLKGLFDEVYIKDIVERKKIERPDVMSQTIDFLCSSTGSLTNANNIAKSLARSQGSGVSVNTVAAYIDHLEDAYLFTEAKRYDVKGHAYFDYPQKYYCEDVGLRNARTGFRHQEATHIMENLIFNELVMRGYSVDVGVVVANERNSLGKNVRVQREIDFVVNRAGERLYIQSAYALPDEEKRLAELKPFSLTGDSFRKIIVRNDVGRKWFDENGILNLSVFDFLLDESALG